MKSNLSEHSKVYVWSSYSNQVKAEGTVLYTDIQHTIVDTGAEKIKADTVDVYPVYAGPAIDGAFAETFSVAIVDNDYHSKIDEFMVNAHSKFAAEKWCTQKSCSAYNYMVTEKHNWITAEPKVDLCGK